MGKIILNNKIKENNIKILIIILMLNHKMLHYPKEIK
jgi:hypothetical protein